MALSSSSKLPVLIGTLQLSPRTRQLAAASGGEPSIVEEPQWSEESDKEKENWCCASEGKVWFSR
jgi:hypothetical protein